ncbi:MAG TPA: glucose-6-phosphate dehydrogenase assembly protein OpcA [Vicinamibacterales bacterium]|nr:glucose-6-phosphate dehydrogenase assembly protein OpcA [Vicinamibacterales bacterium]
MASVVADRTWRDTDPDEIESALADVWRGIGSDGPVARAVMSNLVVLRECDAGAPAEIVATPYTETLDAIVGQHPSRVIVLWHETGCPLARGPLAARVGVTTYGPPHARYAVEHVVVRSTCDAASLPSIVRRLIRGDLPTSIWCPDDLSRRPPLHAVVAEARQLIYDSARWGDVAAGFAAVADAIGNRPVDIADLAWRRLTPVRQALRHAGDELSRDDLRAARIRIVHARRDAALAWLLRGWLATRFGWSDTTQPQIDPVDDPAAPLVLTVGAAGRESTIELDADRVLVSQHGWPPYAVGVRRETVDAAVAAELRSLVVDRTLRDAVTFLGRS